VCNSPWITRCPHAGQRPTAWHLTIRWFIPAYFTVERVAPGASKLGFTTHFVPARLKDSECV